MIGRLKALFKSEFEFNGISKIEFPFVYDNVFYFKGLIGLDNVKYVVENGQLFLHINNLVLVIQSSEEIFILHEIFVDNSYQLFSPNPFVFLDVGLNAGFTTLYFASNPMLKKAYGFELFPNTLDQAHINFGLNPDLSGKIETFGFGLGKEDKEVELEYSFKFKGNVGIHGITKHLVIDGLANDIQRKTVLLRKSSTVLAPIIANHPKENVVLKLDCEGSEYDILEELAESLVLLKIDILLIEWHFRGFEKLVNILMKNGFGCFVQGKNTDDIGILFAFKEK